MASLKDKVVVVAGGTGSVGEGLVKSFLGHGALVVVPVRSAQKQRNLEEHVAEISAGTLRCIEAQVGDEESVNAFRKQVLEEFGSVDMAVACMGTWYYGYSLHRMPYEDWKQIIQNNLNTHFLFMRAFLSALHVQREGVYVMINGGNSELIAPETGAFSIAAAAQKMMTRVLAEEARGTNVRVHSVVAFNPVKTRDRRREVMEEWITPEELGEYVARLYEGSLPNTDETIHTIYTTQDLKRSLQSGQKRA